MSNDEACVAGANSRMANMISSLETAIAERIDDYLMVLTQERNANAAADYYTGTAYDDHYR